MWYPEKLIYENEIVHFVRDEPISRKDFDMITWCIYNEPQMPLAPEACELTLIINNERYVVGGSGKCGLGIGSYMYVSSLLTNAFTFRLGETERLAVLNEMVICEERKKCLNKLSECEITELTDDISFLENISERLTLFDDDVDLNYVRDEVANRLAFLKSKFVQKQCEKVGYQLRLLMLNESRLPLTPVVQALETLANTFYKGKIILSPSDTGINIKNPSAEVATALRMALNSLNTHLPKPAFTVI